MELETSKRKLSPFRIPGIIQRIRLAGCTAEDLALLRQLSATFKEIMSPLYFYKLNKTIWVNYNNLKLKLNRSTPNFPYIPIMILINRENWTPELASVCRKIRINNYNLSGQTQTDELSISDMAPVLGQFVTQLVFNPLSCGWKWAESAGISQSDSVETNAGKSNQETPKQKFFRILGHFLSNFHNLKRIEFRYNRFTNCPNAEDMVPIIQKLNPSTKKRFMIKTFDYGYLVPKWFEDYKNLVVNLKLFPNVKFHIGHGELKLYQDFVLVSDFILQNLNVLIKPSVRIEADAKWFPAENMEANFKAKLVELSPHLYSLYYKGWTHDGGGLRYERLVSSITFKNLKYLKIANYIEPWKLVQNCPSIQRLDLDIRDERIIFSNSELTDEENIQEFIKSFGMEQLKLVTFQYECHHNNKIMPNNSLGLYLKSLLPEKVKFEWSGYWPQT